MVLERWCFAKQLWETISDGFTRKNISLSVFNPSTGKYRPEITLYLDTFNAVLYSLICFKSSPPELFYFKCFLQICSIFTGEHLHGNTTSETQLNVCSKVLSSSIHILRHRKLFCGCRRMPDCFVEVNMYRESRM